MAAPTERFWKPWRPEPYKAADLGFATGAFTAQTACGPKRRRQGIHGHAAKDHEGSLASVSGRHLGPRRDALHAATHPDTAPPILIGGMGEKVLLRLVARYADACNLFSAIGPDEPGKKLNALRRHCQSEGRDYAAIRKTILWVGAQSVGDARDA